MTTRSADECEMSRSCQSATFSSPTTAAARTTRARPQMRSATTGLRLCGIADEPFWPRPNGSSTSRTSVRARWRISSANLSSDEAATRERARAAPRAGRAGGSASRPAPARARAARRRCARPRDRSPRTCRRRRRACRRACLRARARARARAAVELERPARELQPERRRLGVDAVRAADASASAGAPPRARRRRRARGRCPRAISAPASRICSASAVSTTSDEVSP